MVYKNLCNLVLWKKVVLALLELRGSALVALLKSVRKRVSEGISFDNWL